MYVDPRGPRFGAAVTTVVLALVLLTSSGWLLAAQAVVFGVGAFAGLRFAPYGLLYRRLVAPRLASTGGRTCRTQSVVTSSTRSSSRSCCRRKASATTTRSCSTAATTTGSRRTRTGTSSSTATTTSSCSTAVARSGSSTAASW